MAYERETLRALESIAKSLKHIEREIKRSNDYNQKLVNAGEYADDETTQGSLMSAT